jgi:hypothetical protein
MNVKKLPKAEETAKWWSNVASQSFLGGITHPAIRQLVIAGQKPAGLTTISV